MPLFVNSEGSRSIGIDPRMPQTLGLDDGPEQTSVLTKFTLHQTY